MPRAGVIRLGIKVQKPGGKEYPKETDYFVCPDLVKEKYGPEPKELVIMFPVESEQVFFQQFYKRYGNGILLCRGDGEHATGYDFEAKDFVDIECPCKELDEGGCKAVGVLQFLLPEIEEAVGVWQISTGSKNSIIDLNSGIDFVRGLVGRIAMIPLILKREEITTQKIDDGEVIKGRHYTMKLSIGMSLMKIQQLGLIPPTKALLPSPIETLAVVEDLYPPDGFDPLKQEEREPLKEAIKAPADPPPADQFEKTDLEASKKELKEILIKISSFRDLTDAEAVKLDTLETFIDYRSKITYWKRELSKLEGSKN